MNTNLANFAQNVQQYTNVHFLAQVVIGFVLTISIIVLAYIISKHIVEKAVRIFLESLGVDEIMEELELNKALGRYKLSGILAILARWYTFFYILTVSAGIFNLVAVIPVLNVLLAFIGNLIAATLILLLFYLMAYYVRQKAQESESPALTLLGEGAYVLLITIGIISALRQLNIQGIEMIYQIVTIAIGSFFVAFSIAFGIALGLALKDKVAEQIENFFLGEIEEEANKKKSKAKSKAK